MTVFTIKHRIVLLLMMVVFVNTLLAGGLQLHAVSQADRTQPVANGGTLSDLLAGSKVTIFVLFAALLASGAGVWFAIGQLFCPLAEVTRALERQLNQPSPHLRAFA